MDSQGPVSPLGVQTKQTKVCLIEIERNSLVSGGKIHQSANRGRDDITDDFFFQGIVLHLIRTTEEVLSITQTIHLLGIIFPSLPLALSKSPTFSNFRSLSRIDSPYVDAKVPFFVNSDVNFRLLIHVGRNSWLLASKAEREIKKFSCSKNMNQNY